MNIDNTTYTVQWSLFTEADSPESAVRIAISELTQMLSAPRFGANRFTVFSEKDGQEVSTFVNAYDLDEYIEDVDVWSAFQSPNT